MNNMSNCLASEKRGTQIQITEAAEEWCHAFGSVDRPDDVAFVEQEIRKAWAATEPHGDRGKDEQLENKASQSDIVDEVDTDTLKGKQQRSHLHGDGSSNRSRDSGRKVRASNAERLKVTSVLAADVAKGTNLFWVQVRAGKEKMEGEGGEQGTRVAVGFGSKG